MEPEKGLIETQKLAVSNALYCVSSRAEMPGDGMTGLPK